MKKLVTFTVLALLLTFWATPVYAAPPALPHAFYGSVAINGAAAPSGTQVSASVENGTIIPTQNPVTTAVDTYGITSLKLLVQGDGLSGAITFYVNGREATPSPTVIFEIGGGPTLVDLSVTIPVTPSPRAPPPPTIETTIFGIEESFRISSTGEILETIVATSEDENVTITIPEGTIALLEGEPLEALEAAVAPSPPEPPEDAHIIGLAYDFGPDGATFEPPITLTFSYDPAALPEGVAEEDLVLAYYDEATGEWVELDSVVDTVNNSITASVAHFTTFAIIGTVTEEEVPIVVPPVGEEEEEEEEEEPEVVILPEPAAFSVSYLSVSPRLEVEPGETVAITVLVANTGGESGSYTVVLKIDGVKEAEETVTVAAGESQEVSFSVTKEDPGDYTVAVDGLSGSFTVATPEEEEEEVPLKPGFNWTLYGGIIGGVIVAAGLLIYFFVFRRRAY